jgi:hypothetical protein
MTMSRTTLMSVMPLESTKSVSRSHRGSTSPLLVLLANYMLKLVVSVASEVIVSRIQY